MPVSFPRRIPFLPRLLPSSRTAARVWTRLAIATNWPVLAAVAVLTTAGVISIYAFDAAQTVPTGQGKRQLLYFAVAFVCLVAFQAVNYLRIGRLAWGFYALSFLPLAYTV